MLLLRRRPDLVCQQVVELVSDYLDGALSRADRRRFESHLRHCPHCTTYLAQMRITIASTGTLRQDDVPPEAWDDLTELYRSWNAGRDRGDPASS